MSALIQYVLAHWVEIIAALSAVVGAARLVVKLTPTPKDDTALEKIIAALKHVGLVIEG